MLIMNKFIGIPIIYLHSRIFIINNFERKIHKKMYFDKIDIENGKSAHNEFPM